MDNHKIQGTDIVDCFCRYLLLVVTANSRVPFSSVVCRSFLAFILIFFQSKITKFNKIEINSSSMMNTDID